MKKIDFTTHFPSSVYDHSCERVIIQKWREADLRQKYIFFLFLKLTLLPSKKYQRGCTNYGSLNSSVSNLPFDRSFFRECICRFERTVIIMAWRICNKGARWNLLLLYLLNIKKENPANPFQIPHKASKTGQKTLLLFLRISFTRFAFIK